ncbi:MAG TPA: 30S ribosomal protein S20 [Microthrixaceae bacterium]|jgi:small subunit ribosomal protein S20|nr:30S ribosomal protein S20 [Microthrixaceae bacterium]
MANIKSQIKRNRQNDKANERNRAVRSELKTRTKRVDDAISAGDDVTELYRDAISRIDQAAAKGVLHKNTAARRKARLAKKVNAAG